MTNRATYETAFDLDREAQVIDAIVVATDTARSGLKFRKLPRHYECDYAMLMRGVIVGFAEVKVRSVRYDTLMLSAHKALALKRWAQEGLSARLVVCLPDGVFARRMARNEELVLRFGGRTDRGDGQDVEPVAHFPMAGFARLCDAPAGMYETVLT